MERGGFRGGRGGGRGGPPSRGFGGGRGRGGFGDRGGGRGAPRGGRGAPRGGRGGGGAGRGGIGAGAKVLVVPHDRFKGVFILRGKDDAIVTKNMNPGESVYNEKRVTMEVSYINQSHDTTLLLRKRSCPLIVHHAYNIFYNL